MKIRLENPIGAEAYSFIFFDKKSGLYQIGFI
jgi:hypothetical protein